MSLLRTALVTNSGFLRDLRRDDAGPSHFDTEGATVRLAIGRGGAAALLSETLYAPVIPYRGEPLSAGFRGLAGDANVIPAWVKPAESGGRAWILRLHEIRGHAGTVSIELDDGWEAFRTDLREVVADPLEGGRSFALRANAFGSVLIRPR